jgi:hypothetical protein
MEISCKYCKGLFRIIFIVLFKLVEWSPSLNAQEVDTMIFSDRFFGLKDDRYLIGGLNYSGIYYSKNFRQLGYSPGYFVGMEQYFPSTGKYFTTVGVHLVNHPFVHHVLMDKVRFQNIYLELPLAFSYELPVFKTFDLRFMLGGFGSLRLKSWSSKDYPNGFDEHRYDVAAFSRTDFGWLFGVSMEYDNFIIRLRSVSGFKKLDRNEQGMMHGLSIESGYFLFREKRFKK